MIVLLVIRRTKQALLEEIELSLPFRETALEHVLDRLPRDTIEDILGVAAAKENPGCVLKVLINLTAVFLFK